VAVPSPTGGWAAHAAGVPATPAKITMATAAPAGSTGASQRRARRGRVTATIDVTTFPLPRTITTGRRLYRRGAEGVSRSGKP
jgi:hypothetical protein